MGYGSKTQPTVIEVAAISHFRRLITVKKFSGFLIRQTANNPSVYRIKMVSRYVT